MRSDLKDRSFHPLPVRERTIPKPETAKRRRLGIPTVRDRVVQASLKLVLEPIFEADFLPCSYGFRPRRRAHDALAEAHHFAKSSIPTRRFTSADQPVRTSAPKPVRRHRATQHLGRRRHLGAWSSIAKDDYRGQ